jgi:hypothetical protein
MMIPPPAKIRDIACRAMAPDGVPPYAQRHNGSSLLSASGVPMSSLGLRGLAGLRGNQAILANRPSPGVHQAAGMRKP